MHPAEMRLPPPFRRLPSQVDVKEVKDHIFMDTTRCALFLLENGMKLWDHLDDCVEATEYLSLSDSLLGKWEVPIIGGFLQH
jgi:hypothetical protein